MHKTNLPKSPKVYVTLLCLWVLLLLMMPRIGKFSYDYRKGAPWSYETLVAQFDFPILKTQEQMQQERQKAGSNVVPYFRYSEEAVRKGLGWAEGFGSDECPGLSQAYSASLKDIYSKGVVADGALDSVTSGILFLQRDKRASRIPASDVYALKDARSKVLSDLREGYPQVNMDSLLNVSGAYDAIIPNLVFDNETTMLVHAQDVDFISPTQGVVNAGEILVYKGELVTAEVQQILDSYKAEYENSVGYSGSSLLQWLGNLLIALSIVLILFLSVFYTNPVIFEEYNRFFYLVFIFFLTAAEALFIDRFNPDLLYLAPFTLTAMLLLAFFKLRVVLPVYIVSLIPVLVYAHNGLELFIIYLTAGVVVMYVYQFLSKGWKQFLMALVSAVAAILTYLGFRLVNDVPLFSDLSRIGHLCLGSLLAVAGYPLIFLFERMFNLVSANRLMELCDTNSNKLLTELAHKAPGTFQHCLQVMNMADSVASAIGANVLLARAGALYHDIGKMMNPLCFIENAPAGSDYHGNLTPQESARDIIKHVSDGLVLADSHSLPQVVKDFILTHHGTSCTGYFYNRYLNSGGDPAHTEDFFYRGRKPWTKEQTIVMVCDTIEAASRTLKDNSPETFDAFVEKIVSAKINDGQLSDADITLKELGIMKSILKEYLVGLYHDRIAYPKRRR